MCTNVSIRTDIEGSAKGPRGWFKVDTAQVSFDHPVHAPFEHSLNIDFVHEASGASTRVAVELSASAARALVDNIILALSRGELEAGGRDATIDRTISRMGQRPSSLRPR